MTVIYDLKHITTYSYRNPVTFGEHRTVFLPSAGYSERILSYLVETNVPSKIRRLMDTLSNNVAAIEFSEPTQKLIVTCQLRAEHFGMKAIAEFPLDARAIKIPVQYTLDEWVDLSAFMRPHAEDPDGSVAAWAKSFVAGDQDDTLDVLQRMMDNILIWVAIARHPEQVMPLSGSWFGDALGYLGMDVKVAIRKLGTLPEFEEGK